MYWPYPWQTAHHFVTDIELFTRVLNSGGPAQGHIVVQSSTLAFRADVHPVIPVYLQAISDQRTLCKKVKEETFPVFSYDRIYF
jgi:hypothetical protein